ncbi:exodeoxyribonuclease I [Marinobacterium lutimaris]|uniref:Exodeoxyribonuclease I n=1 Tax=Marinobacterium lutimaris TaxID=568106 RepID=A0A1H6CC26_9GAMM|nr:exodeoxyribonuclease I [Marinobacterium lutimaris]SEG70317.1 Exodeoxyribonuclease I subunit C [Marinobacterium lutimaris]
MAKAQDTFFWHDYETFGTDPARDRPVQFAGVRTDADFNIIEEPLVVFAIPSEDILPHPQACLVTGITPQQALAEGVCEAEFIRQIHEQLARPGTCAVGYNSIRFDDEVTRNTLYRNFYDPYAREWQNGCSRWDIIDMLRLTRALRPEGIEWPTYEDGTPSLRLEDLSKANGLAHEQAHDALSDVYATIAVAKLVRERQPKLFDYVLNNRGKRAIQSKLDVPAMKPVLHVSSKYPVEWGNAAIVAPLTWHPVNRNAAAVWDLRVDPTPLFELSVEQIRELLYTRHDERPADAPQIALKLLHTNRCPIVAPAGMLNAEEAARLNIDGDTCRRHLAMLRAEPGLLEKLIALYTDEHPPSDGDPDHMLYSGGFFGDSDRVLMEQVRNAAPEELALMEPPFQDPRLEEMLLRYKARNFPEAMREDEHQRWEEYRSHKLLNENNNGYLTIPRFYEELNKLAQQPTISDRDKLILEELAFYAESIYPLEY